MADELLTADLTEVEINAICDPLRQGAAQVRFLESLSPLLIVRRRANGNPLVNRAHYNEVMSGRVSGAPAAQHEPQWSVPA